MRKFFTCKLFTAVFTLIVLAGCTGSETLPTQPGEYFNDLWEYNGSAWQPIPLAIPTDPSPSARRDHTAVVATVSSSTYMFVFGGFNGTYLNDLWQTTFGITSSWNKIEPAQPEDPWPSARRGHSAVEYNGKMYIFGGFNGGLLSDLWEYDPDPLVNKWTQKEPVTGEEWPGGRRFHTAVQYSDKMYIFGGDNGFYLNEVWEYDFTTKKWTQKSQIGTVPPRRNGHSAIVDGSGQMYIFGGWTTGGIRLNDVWEYNINTDSWLQHSPSTAPTARGVHSAVLLGSEMVVFGGYDIAALNETWTYNLANTWTLENPSTIPPARYAHSAVVSGGNMYVFGGYGPPTQ